MNKLTLMVLPLAALFIMSTLAMLGLGAYQPDFADGFTLYDVNTSTDAEGNYLVLYDYTGSATCYWNGTSYNGENGWITKNAYTPDAVWRNSSGAYGLDWGTNNDDPVKYADCQSVLGFQTGSHIKESAKSYDIADSLSWIVVVTAIMAIGTIAGIKVFGTGLTELSVKVLLVGTFSLTIWGILTAMCYPLFLEGGFYVFIIYGALALTYCIGTALTMAGD